MGGDFLTLSRLAGIITDLSLFTPTNLAAEKEKVFADSSYIPQFTYKGLGFSIDEYREELDVYLRGVQDEDNRISDLVHERVRELLHWLDLHDAKTNDDFTAASLALYGSPSPRIVAFAQQDIDTLENTDVPKRLLTPEDIKPDLEKALADVGVSWPVVITDGMIARMHVVKGKELRINASARFTKEEVEKLIVHEVKTHVQRYVNGIKQENKIFALGTALFLETEEGFYSIWEQSQPDLSHPLVMNFLPREEAEHILT